MAGRYLRSVGGTLPTLRRPSSPAFQCMSSGTMQLSTAPQKIGAEFVVCKIGGCNCRSGKGLCCSMTSSVNSAPHLRGAVLSQGASEGSSVRSGSFDLGVPPFRRGHRASVFCLSPSRRLRTPSHRPEYTLSGVTLPRSSRLGTADRLDEASRRGRTEREAAGGCHQEVALGNAGLRGHVLQGTKTHETPRRHPAHGGRQGRGLAARRRRESSS